jgi:hypothetical protein
MVFTNSSRGRLLLPVLAFFIFWNSSFLVDLYKILVGKPKVMRPLERPRRIWKNNIKMDLKGMGWARVDWVHLVRHRGQWHTLVSLVWNLRVLWNAEDLLASLQGLSSPCGGRLEYLHRSPATRRRRRKGNPVPGVITGVPCSWGI